MSAGLNANEHNLEKIPNNLDFTLNDSKDTSELTTLTRNVMIESNINPLVAMDSQSENLDEDQLYDDIENFQTHETKVLRVGPALKVEGKPIEETAESERVPSRNYLSSCINSLKIYQKEISKSNSMDDEDEELEGPVSASRSNK